jgi:hypothetical protein
MKTILNHFDRLMAAITFAEANEPALAMEFTGGRRPAQTPPAQSAKMTDGKVLTNQTAH